VAIRMYLRIFLLLSFVCSVSACAPRTGTVVTLATPAQTPTSTPIDLWQQVQKRGTLVVGTSVDYPPFEYYNQNFTFDGFDIALMREIGKALGVKVEFKDIAFDGLAAALTVNQIDVAIGAISVVPEREQMLSFSQVYYVGEDAVLAANRSMPSVHTYKDLANFTVAVQKGSVYASLLQEQLIDTGLMKPKALLLYSSMERAVADLKRGAVALVLLDLGPAQNFAKQGQVAVVGQGLTRARYAVALPKGAETLRAQINDALDALHARGVVSTLTQKHLKLKPSEVQPLLTATPPPTVPVTTTAVAATTVPTVAVQAQPSACIDAMAYVADLTYDDQNMTQPPIFAPGQAFRKGWRVRNIGSCVWQGYSLAFAEGNAPTAALGGQPVTIKGPIQPGATYDLYVDLVAPMASGIYQGTWQMHNDQGTPFGERVWVGITVLGRLSP